jgi:acyl-CoA thioester hydrolase
MRLSATPSRDPAAYVFVHRVRVRFAETDAMGIVHHSRYLPYLEEARVAYLRHIGHPYTENQAAGIDYAVLEQWIQYVEPLRFDDEVDVHLVVAGGTRTTFELAYLLTVGDAVRSLGVTVHGAVTSTGRPARLPAWLRELAAAEPSTRPS